MYVQVVMSVRQTDVVLGNLSFFALTLMSYCTITLLVSDWVNWCVDGLAQFAADCSNPGSSAAAAFAVSNPLNCLFLSLKAIRICYSVFWVKNGASIEAAADVLFCYTSNCIYIDAVIKPERSNCFNWLMIKFGYSRWCWMRPVVELICACNSRLMLLVVDLKHIWSSIIVVVVREERRCTIGCCKPIHSGLAGFRSVWRWGSFRRLKMAVCKFLLEPNQPHVGFSLVSVDWCVDGLAQFAADCSNPGSSAAAAFAVSNPLNCLFHSLKAIRICYSVFWVEKCCVHWSCCWCFILLTSNCIYIVAVIKHERSNCFNYVNGQVRIFHVRILVLSWFVLAIPDSATEVVDEDVWSSIIVVVVREERRCTIGCCKPIHRWLGWFS